LKSSDVAELHYITPIANVQSILKLGIVSHNQAAKIKHSSVAMQEIQDRRSKVVVPGGKPLHDYVNLYFTARNPMMYKRHASHSDLCILRISTEVLQISGIVITDQNASSKYVRFGSYPDAFEWLDKERLFAESWQHEDTVEQWRHTSLKCAEVLVPYRVPPELILGGYVSCQTNVQLLLNLFPTNGVILNPDLFFQ
jgi:hypothetical protein